MARDSAPALQRTNVPIGSSVVLLVSKGPAPAGSQSVSVPDVVGSAQAKALTALQQVGLNAQIFTQASDSAPRGSVIAQWPKAGDIADSGATAALLVSSGPAAEGSPLVGVPMVVGQTEAAAIDALDTRGLKPAVVRVFSPTVAEGIVLGQLPEERSAVPAKTSPWIWVVVAVAIVALLAAAFFLFGRGGTGKMIAVPSVVGQEQALAEEAITGAGLVVGKITESDSDTATAGTVMAQNPVEGTEVDEGSKVDLVVATASDLVEVPDVVGQPKDAALQTLARARLQVAVTESASDDVAEGDVISQSPKAGQRVPADTEVGIVVSTGAAQAENVQVPNVVGFKEADAENDLEDAGLKIETVETYSSTVPAGTVVGQAPAAGASVAPGTQIALLVSAGPDPAAGQPVTIPGVIGKSLTDATAELTAAGLKVASYKLDGSGKPVDIVLYQTPAAGGQVPKDSQVVLVVSSGQ